MSADMHMSAGMQARNKTMGGIVVAASLLLLLACLLAVLALHHQTMTAHMECRVVSLTSQRCEITPDGGQQISNYLVEMLTMPDHPDVSAELVERVSSCSSVAQTRRCLQCPVTPQHYINCHSQGWGARLSIVPDHTYILCGVLIFAVLSVTPLIVTLAYVIDRKGRRLH